MIASGGAIRSFGDRVLAVQALFLERGADAIFHGAKPMVRHAEHTQAVLQSWECPDDVRLAGWLHSVYAALMPGSHDDRELVAGVVGERSEEIIHLVTTTCRAEIERRMAVLPKDTAESIWKDCGLLCLASDIALLGSVPIERRQLESLRYFASLCLPHLPPSGRDELVRLFNLDQAPSVDSWTRTVRDSYDLIATGGQTRGATGAWDVQVLDLLDRVLPERARVLDLGCGDGTVIARHLAERFSVHGLDISWRQLLLAHKMFGPSRLVCADLLNLPYRDGAFDAVCSCHAIAHLPRATHGQIAHQINRVLGPEGWVLICLGADDLPGRKHADEPGAPLWWSHYEADEFLRLLAEQGFSVRWSHVTETASEASAVFVLAQRE